MPDETAYVKSGCEIEQVCVDSVCRRRPSHNQQTIVRRDRHGRAHLEQYFEAPHFFSRGDCPEARPIPWVLVIAERQNKTAIGREANFLNRSWIAHESAHFRAC